VAGDAAMIDAWMRIAIMAGLLTSIMWMSPL
jgi:hypothetical protein